MLLATAGVVGWCSFGARGDVLKPDGGPVVTVMDFGRSFPLDPLPSGWKHQGFDGLVLALNRKVDLLSTVARAS